MAAVEALAQLCLQDPLEEEEEDEEEDLENEEELLVRGDRGRSSAWKRGSLSQARADSQDP